jgi:LPXTG-motif cell wall-anchored protein
MAKGAKRGGRVTPKKQASASGRYTPPIPKAKKVSPIWVPVLMFTCLGLGVLIILANYVGLMPGGEANNWYLLIGLALITTGFLTATQYR